MASPEPNAFQLFYLDPIQDLTSYYQRSTASADCKDMNKKFKFQNFCLRKDLVKAV